MQGARSELACNKYSAVSPADVERYPGEPVFCLAPGQLIDCNEQGSWQASGLPCHAVR
jgi:hypothetical protein